MRAFRESNVHCFDRAAGISEDEPWAQLGVPNGEMDPWASAIVAQRFRYVQVSAYYTQVSDIPSERLAELPDNPFCDRIREKQPEISANRLAADQVSVLAFGLAAVSAGIWPIMYLLPDVNLRLRPKLLKDLKVGTRIVSHSFDMDDWQPEKTHEQTGRIIRLWTVTEKAKIAYGGQ